MGDHPASGIDIDALSRVVMVAGENNPPGEGRPDRRSRSGAEVHSPVGASGLFVQYPPPPVGTCHDTVHRPGKGKPPFPGQGYRGKGFADGFSFLGNPGQDICRGRHHALRKGQMILLVFYRGHPDGTGDLAAGSVGLERDLHHVGPRLHLAGLCSEQAEGNVMVIPYGHIEGYAPALPFHGHSREGGGRGHPYHEGVSRPHR